MTTEQITLAACKTAIFDKIETIFDLRDETWDFVKSKHTLADCDARMREIADHSKDVSRFGRALNAMKRAEPGLQLSIIDVVADLDRLNGLVVEIQILLARDHEIKQREADGKKVDVVKNATFILGIPGLFVTGVRNGIGNGHIDVNEAMLIGFAVSIPTVFHKSVRKTFSNVANNVCAVPRGLRAVPASIGDDMRTVYIRETIRETTTNAKLCFSAAAKAINDNARVGRAQTAAFAKRVFGRRGPRP